MVRGMLVAFLVTAAAAPSAGHLAIPSGDLKWVDGPAGLPAGAKMALLEGDPNKPGPFVIRFKFPDGFKVPPHWHPADERVTVLTGTFLIGEGDKWDQGKAQALGPGAYMMMPRRHHHFAGSQGETTLQLHGMGPWKIFYVSPADDPRRKLPK